MSRTRTLLGVAAIMMLALGAFALPTLAQTDTTANPQYPENTITVTGYGTVHADPDVAAVDVGVDVTRPTVSDAFAEANTTLQSIMDAVTALGIAPEDIQTSNLSVYTTSGFDPQSGSDTKGYTVSNTIHVVVRDVSQVEDVIDAAINAGATTLYGLSFDLQDRAALESQARELAMQDAQARAAEYASLIGAQLGDVVVVSEAQTGGFLPYASVSARAQGGGGGAVVTPGQTDVQIQVSVTYQIAR